jgi:hypothetical protein
MSRTSFIDEEADSHSFRQDIPFAQVPDAGNHLGRLRQGNCAPTSFSFCSTTASN